MLSTEYDSNYRERVQSIQKLILDARDLKYKNSYTRFLEFFHGDEDFTVGTWTFARSRRNTRYLMKKDICLVLLTNGTERQPVWCASTKGKKITGYYHDTDRCGIPHDVQLIGVPGELVGMQLTHPDVQAFTLKLRTDRGPQPGMCE